MAGDFLHVNEETISQWPLPNVVNPESRTWFLTYSITLTAFTSAVVFARLWSRAAKSTAGLGVDDVLIAVGWLSGILLATACLLGTQRYGFDRHMWDVPATLYNKAALVQWLTEGLFVLSTCCTKVSVLCFFRRLNPLCSTALKCLIYAFIIFTAFDALADLLTLLLQCHPISGSWTIPKLDQPNDRTCINKQKYYLVHGLLTCFSTAYTIIIPVLVLRHFSMTQLQRTGLKWIAVVSLSVLGAGIARTVFLYRFVASTNGDATWNGFNIFVYAQAECQLALICASLPFLQHFTRHNFTVPIVFYPDIETNSPRNSFMSRISGSVRSSTKRPHGHRSQDTTTPTASPLGRETPEWEFQVLRSPAGTMRHSTETAYERYRQGDFGPPVPPKDLGEWLEKYRRDHGRPVGELPF